METTIQGLGRRVSQNQGDFFWWSLDEGLYKVFWGLLGPLLMDTRRNGLRGRISLPVCCVQLCTIVFPKPSVVIPCGRLLGALWRESPETMRELPRPLHAHVDFGMQPYPDPLKDPKNGTPL